MSRIIGPGIREMADERRDRDSVRMAIGLLNVIRLMGYHVRVLRGEGLTEIEAVGVKDHTDRFLARTAGVAPDDEYAAACQLAEMLGLDPEEC